MEDNPAECNVCFAVFTPGDDHRARSLPCGHTFCTSCLTYLLEQGRGTLACPECRNQHSATDATQFPVNFAMEALLDQLKCLRIPLPPSPYAPSAPPADGGECQREDVKGQVEEMKEKVIKLLLECGSAQTQLNTHQQRLKEPRSRHMTLLTRLCDLVAENRSAVMRLDGSLGQVQELAEEGKGYTLQLQVALTSLESAAETEVVMKRVASRVEQVEGWRERCDCLCGDGGDGGDGDDALVLSSKTLENTESALSTLAAQEDNSAAAGDYDDDDDFIGAVGGGGGGGVLMRAEHTLTPLPSQANTLSIDDVRLLTPQVTRLLQGQQVWGVYQNKASRFTLESGRLHMYHLSSEPPPTHAHTLQVSHYLSTSFYFCLLAFLDLSWDNEVKGRVYIRLDKAAPLSRQFVILCTGQMQHTYANTALLKVCGRHSPGEFVIGGDYECDDGSGGAALLPDLYQGLKKKGAVGSVWGRFDVDSQRSAQFAITTRQCQGAIPRVFGVVEEGLDVVRQAANVLGRRRVMVAECGVVVAP